METLKKYFSDILYLFWSKLTEWVYWILDNLEWVILKLLDYLIHIGEIIGLVFFGIMPNFDFPDSFDSAARLFFEYVPLINKVFPVLEFFSLCTVYLCLYFFSFTPYRWISRMFPFFGRKK
jgi:hypothetical protein